MIRKLLCMMLVVMMIASMLVSFGMVSYASGSVCADEACVYENDFSTTYISNSELTNGKIPAGGAMEVLVNGKGKIYKQSGRVGKAPVSTADGYVGHGADADTIELIRYEPVSPLTTGLLTVSYSFKYRNNGANGANEQTRIRYNGDGTNGSGKFAMTTENVNKNKGDGYIYVAKTAEDITASQLEKTASIATMTHGTKYTIRQEFNLVLHTIKTYVNDELKSTGYFAGSIENIAIDSSGATEAFDDIKIHFENISMTVKEIAVTHTASTAVITLSDNIAQDGFAQDGFSVTNLMTGKTVSASAVVAGKKITLTAADMTFDTGYSYSIVLPAITGELGGKAEAKSYDVNVGEGRYLKGIKLVDVFGKEHLLKTSDNPANVKKLVLWFANKADAEVLDSMLIEATDSNISCISKTVSDTPDESGFYKAEAVLSNYLFGDTQYTIKISGLDIAYNIPLNTGEGEILIQDCVFEKVILGDATTYQTITNLDNINDGDKIRITLNVVKTSRDKKSFAWLYTLCNGFDLNDFDYKNIVLESSETEKTEYMTVTVAESDNAKLKVLFRNSLTDIRPLSDASILE